MADEGRRTPQVSGRGSPARESAKPQRMSGEQSGPQEAGEQPRAEQQPSQGSVRRDPAHEHERTVRKGYDAAQEPESQGDGDPGPDRVPQSSGMQQVGGDGAGGAGGAGGAVDAGNVGQRGQSSEPAAQHAREGRQKPRVEGDPQQPA
jgi:hypothetical protein